MPREIRVVHHQLRWEVQVDGVARPMEDWFCTKERAIEHARARAREVDAALVVVEGADWAIEEILHVDRGSGRYPVATSEPRSEQSAPAPARRAPHA